jgi:hemoglobin
MTDWRLRGSVKFKGEPIMSSESLYTRLGGYDAIAAVTNAVYPQMQSDDKMRRFWDHRGDDGIEREKQLLIDFVCAATGGPLLYTGRGMVPVHKGMQIDEDDWQRLIGYLTETLGSFDVSEQEGSELLALVESTKQEIVE